MDRKQPVFDFLDARGITTNGMNTPRPRPSKSPASGGATTVRNTARTSLPRNHKGDRLPRVSIRSGRWPSATSKPACARNPASVPPRPRRMERWLRLRPGSVAFRADQRPGEPRPPVPRRQPARPAYSFHPNDNRATVVIPQEEFLKYLAAVGNSYEFIETY